MSSASSTRSKRQARQTVHRAKAPVDAKAMRWPKVDEEAVRTLPPVLKAIVRALGWGGAREFLVRHGGLCVYIPEGKGSALGLSEPELQRLRIVLEPHLATNRVIALPKPDKLFLRWRDEEFARDAQNMTVRELALKYKITTRWVLLLKHKCEGVQDQPGTKPGQLGLEF